MSEQKHKAGSKKTEEVTDEEVEVPEPKEFEIDDILEEIDDVLEENAEEFVKSYVQKGGQ
jgi:ubiquitin-like protein Pup